MKRALRRHHRRRIIAKWRRICDHWWLDDKDTWALLMYGQGSIRCGCWMCANPRKLGELLQHEKRSDISMSEQLREINEDKNTCPGCKRYYACPIKEKHGVYCPFCGTELIDYPT